jgi:hypothetical protein
VEFSQELLLLLFEYASKFIRDPATMPVPQSILDEVDEYMQDNDPVGEWIAENLEITNDKRDRIRYKDVCDHYNLGRRMEERVTAQKLPNLMREHGIQNSRMNPSQKL